VRWAVKLGFPKLKRMFRGKSAFGFIFYLTNLPFSRIKPDPTDALRFFETSVNICQATRHNFPDKFTLPQHHCENLNSREWDCSLLRYRWNVIEEMCFVSVGYILVILPIHCTCRGSLSRLIPLSDTHTHTLGRTPLDERSARRRDLYLTTHNTHNRQTS
jgi:hypothetical protein